MIPVLNADCSECKNSAVKPDGHRMCNVKHIDCSVRKGERPCSHYESKFETPDRRFIITMSAVGRCEVKAKNIEEARQKADWCDCEIIHTMIDGFQEV